MREALKKLVVKLLHETADKIDAGTCELSDLQCVVDMVIEWVVKHNKRSVKATLIY
jgi:hypothetical protein